MPTTTKVTLSIGDDVIVPNLPHFRACSSAGQSNRLIIWRSRVQTPPSPQSNQGRSDEMVDIGDLKSLGHCARVGSNPIFGTNKCGNMAKYVIPKVYFDEAKNLYPDEKDKNRLMRIAGLIKLIKNSCYGKSGVQ